VSNTLTTAPVRPFQRVLESLATRMGWDPARIQANQSAALTAYLNTAMQTVWNFYEWPEIMRSELLPATGGVIPWQAGRVPTAEVSNNGNLLVNLLDWSQGGALFTFAAPAGANFSVNAANAVDGGVGFYQTVEGLTAGATYRLKLVLENCEVGTRAITLWAENDTTEIFREDYYQADFTNGAKTVEVDLQAGAGGEIWMHLSVYSPGANIVTGRISQFTLHATAPGPTIDMVAGVYTTNPLTTDEPVPMPYHLGPGCIYLTGTARDATEAWVYYRPGCPSYTATAYSAATTYQNGGLNELAFSGSTGHVYRAQSSVPFTNIPVTNPAYWLVQGVPERFAEALVQLARAEALEEQDQFAKGLRARATGLDFLENAMLTHYRQSGQTRNYRHAA
jgi:hypothetical protein